MLRLSQICAQQPAADISLHIRCMFDEQDDQLSQKDRAAGCVIVFTKSRRLELENNIFTAIRDLSSTTVI